MATPVAIQLAGAMALSQGNTGGVGPLSPTTPKTPTSPNTQGFPQPRSPSQYLNLNVREVFETHNLEYTKELSKRVNVEIEKKREELRTLVGERYRDLIDAADTIASMSASSSVILGKLSTLRHQLSTLPTQLSAAPIAPTRASVSGDNDTKYSQMLTKEELEIAVELKLSLEVPRVVQKLLDEASVIPASHLYLLFEKSLCQNNKPYRWTFQTNPMKNPSETSLHIKQAIIKTCDEMMEDFSTPTEDLAKCIVAKQVLSRSTCADVVTELLKKRIEMAEQSLLHPQRSSTSFVDDVASTLQDLYLMFIDGQLYNAAAKEMKRPNISMSSFGMKHCPKVVEAFNKESISAEEAPRAGQLAQLLLTFFVHPLQSFLNLHFEQKQYLLEQQSFHELNKYQTETTEILKEKTEDLMRIVLGTSKSLWGEAFYPVFQKKCEEVGRIKIESIFNYLDEDAFPKYRRMDEDFDLVTHIWKPSSASSVTGSIISSSISKDVDLKLKCISPQVADISAEMEERFSHLLKDLQSLGDFTLKKYISSKLVEEWKNFLNGAIVKAPSLFLGRFVSSMSDLCPTIWKLIDVKDGTELRSCFASISEQCWTRWASEVGENFSKNLAATVGEFGQNSVIRFMPVAEEFAPEGDDAVKPSVRVPLQISHSLHTNLFAICSELSRVGPQSVPSTVREKLREIIGSSVIVLYKRKLDASETLSPQSAIQLTFDIKYCQWFHVQLKDQADPVVKRLQSVIDPFDMDIVSPRLKANLKRFLFETHLTLGLLFSEESHSFIAQNFKTKVNMSFPISNPPLSSPLPLLPV